MDATAQATVYLIHAWIRGIHPMLWRRFLVCADNTLADLHYIWQHEIRIEQQCALETGRTDPVYVGGKWGGPPENCGGPAAFLERRCEAPFRVQEILDEMAEDLTAHDRDAVDDRLDELHPWREWLRLDRFDRRAVNRRLAQYAAGDARWMDDE